MAEMEISFPSWSAVPGISRYGSFFAESRGADIAININDGEYIFLFSPWCNVY